MEPELLKPNDTCTDRVSQLPQDSMHVTVETSPDTGSAKRNMVADECDRPPKKLRTGDVVVPDIDASPSTGPNVADYSHGVLRSMCSAFFPQLRRQLGPYFVDKTKLIESIVNTSLNGNIDLVLRPRRCGKSTMLQMLKCFFTIPQDKSEDPRQLFQGLYIADNKKVCEDYMGKYPVIFCDFENLTGGSWEEMFASFKTLVCKIYRGWEEYLWDSLTPTNRAFFVSILFQSASVDEWRDSLTELSCFLAKKSGQKVIVLIDDYEVPNNVAYERKFSDAANQFFGCGVIPLLLKKNIYLAYAVLAGVTPAVQPGWYSGLNNVSKHPLHRRNSVFAGMLMFTETEVLELKRLSKSELDPEDLKAHYRHLADGCISVYNPVSIMSAFEEGMVKNSRIEIGQCPSFTKYLPEDVASIDIIEKLLTRKEVLFSLRDIFTGSECDQLTAYAPLLSGGMLTLLYYAGYLTMAPSRQFRIPNREVMMDWARWITGSVEGLEDILEACTKGPVSSFVKRWPDFMQQQLDTKAVQKARGAYGSKIPEKIYLLGLFYNLELRGWEVIIEHRSGGGYIDIRLISKNMRCVILIELKSSEKPEDIEKDAKQGLQLIIDKGYRKLPSFPNVRFLREYGIASYRLKSHIEGRYLEQNAKGRWVERDDRQDMRSYQ